MKATDIIKFHKSEECFKCHTLVEKSEDGIFRCNCGYEWANLFIKRIPTKPFLIFKEVADKEFCSDYGMAFKSLIDDIGHTEMNNMILLKFQELEERLSRVETTPENTSKNNGYESAL